MTTTDELKQMLESLTGKVKVLQDSEDKTK